MEWTQFLILIATLGGLFLWNRSEARNDYRDLKETQAQDRKEILNLIRAIEQEMKDFHGRLCAIEERNRGK